MSAAALTAALTALLNGDPGNPSGPWGPVTSDIALGTRLAELVALQTTAGAAEIGVLDVATYFAGADVETVLADLGLRWADLASVANGKGASDVGVEDANGYYAALNVEDALAELGPPIQIAIVTVPGGNGAGNVGDLNSSPVELVPAPAAGSFIEFVNAQAWLDWDAGAAYDTAGTMEIGFAGNDAVTGTLAFAGFGDAVADEHRLLGPALTDAAPEAATALELRCSADWFGAAGSSPVKVRVQYRVRTLEF